MYFFSDSLAPIGTFLAIVDLRAGPSYNNLATGIIIHIRGRQANIGSGYSGIMKEKV